MRWVIVAAITVGLAVPGLGQEIRTPGIEVMDACAEIWATKTVAELEVLYDVYSADYDRRMEAFNPQIDAGYEAYEAAKTAYLAAHRKLTESIESMAGKGVDLYVKSLGIDPDKPGSQGQFDALVDAANKTLGPVAQGVDVALQFEGSTDLVTVQQQAEAAMKAARASVVKIQAELDGLQATADRITACARDQKGYLIAFVVGPVPKEEAPVQPEPPRPISDLTPVGTIRTAGVGFQEQPYNHTKVPQPPAGPEGFAPPYWPEACRDLCMANNQCVAWNYVHPEWASPMPPATCEFYLFDDDHFTGYSMMSNRYWSGYGPAAIAKGLARPAD